MHYVLCDLNWIQKSTQYVNEANNNNKQLANIFEQKIIFMMSDKINEKKPAISLVLLLRNCKIYTPT